MRWLLILFCASASHAATYYVATNGNDTAAGTNLASAWLTLTHAATNVTYGDTVVVTQGTYNESVTCSVTAYETNRITFRGSNSPAIKSFMIAKGCYTIDGFFIGSGATTTALGDSAKADHVWIINNTFTNLGYVYPIKFEDYSPAACSNSSWLIVSNNTIWYGDGVNSRAAVTAYGGTNKFLKNKLYGPNTSGGETDFFQVYGRDCIMADNLCQDLGMFSAKGGDFWQVFGFRSWYLVYIVNTTNANGDSMSGHYPVDGDYFVINGITNYWRTNITDAATQVQIATGYQNATNMYNHLVAYPVANTKLYPMEGSSTTHESVSLSTMRVLIAGTDCPTPLSGSWTTNWSLPVIHISDFAAHEVRDITIERNRIINNHYQTCQIEPYENDTNTWQGLIFRNNLLVSNTMGGGFSMNGCKIYNNTFFRNNTANSGNALSWASTKGDAYGFELLNNVFYECGENPASSSAGWYAYGTGMTNWSAVIDYNYVCGLGAASKDAYPPDSSQRWASYGWETHGINSTNGVGGGYAMLTNCYSGYPLLGSCLIGKGTNLSAYFTDDLNGNTRQQWDIGAVGFDSNLLCWLDFSMGITNLIKDASGHNAHAWQFDSTNWITTTNGPNGLTAGVWTFIGTNADGFRQSQYAAITNIAGTGLRKITNGTIALWVKWNTNTIGIALPEDGDALLDAGVNLVNSAVNDMTVASNSWQLMEASPDVAPYNDHPVIQTMAFDSYTETNGILAYWTNQGRAMPCVWNHIAITWAGGNYVQAYENGSLTMSNSLDKPYLGVGGRTNTNPIYWGGVPWICVGAWTHGGTPVWGDDDGYPNNGWFKGAMADIRIYDRTLTANDVGLLYAGSGTGAAAAGEGETPAATNTTRARILGPIRVQGALRLQ